MIEYPPNGRFNYKNREPEDLQECSNLMCYSCVFHESFQRPSGCAARRRFRKEWRPTWESVPGNEL